MIAQMSKRERTLALIVGAIFAILTNLLIFRYFMNQRSRLSEDLMVKRVELEGLQALYADKELWEKRGEWLQSAQPKLENETRAPGQVLEYVHEVAKRHTVLVDAPTLGSVARTPNYTSVTASIETKSTPAALVAFLRDLQTPAAFIVLESANIQVDASEKTQMRGKFRVAKWFAPTQPVR
jgi:hypothetical protein